MFSSHPTHTTASESVLQRVATLPWKWLLGLGLVYLATHLLALAKLPVFADEAIYIRWAQLIMDDARRYALFALNDGKTPLFIWLLVPFQKLFSDQLVAARIVSVLVGLGQVCINIKIAKELGGKKTAQLVAGLATIALPFWFFHHRMALMDGLLVVWLSLSWWAALRAINTKSWSWIVGSGISLGLALLTKLPAILFLPALAIGTLLPFIAQTTQYRALLTKKNIFTWCLHGGVVVGLGLGMFGLLKLDPAFGQLFSRGGDFLFKTNELTFFRIIKNLWEHSRDFLNVFGTYLSWGSFGFLISGVILPKYRRQIILMAVMALAYLFPIMVMGRVIYPRYLLPAALPLTIALALSIETLIDLTTHQTKLARKILLAAILAVLGAQIINVSSRFMLYAWFNPKYLNFTLADQVQYLTEWSAGDGIEQVSKAVLKTAEHDSVLVLTEGYFGTLPDGILLYLHGKDVRNLFVEGIGQPVVSIPPAMVEKSHQYDQVWLVVNSHRMKLNLPQDQLLQQYCRLPGAPCLQVWDLKPYLENLPKDKTENK